MVAIYSTFLQRAYDQLIHDIAIQNLPVVFAIDRAGLVGADGATHHGVFDLSYMRCVPNLTVMAPADADDTWKMLNTAFALGKPAAVRYPRGQASWGLMSSATRQRCRSVAVGLRRQGKKTAFLSFGSVLSAVETVAEHLTPPSPTCVLFKPLDEALIFSACRMNMII